MPALLVCAASLHRAVQQTAQHLLVNWAPSGTSHGCGCCRWGFFIFGCVFMAGIFVILYTDGKSYLAQRDSSMVGFYNSLVLTLIVLWTLYPVVWAFSEGTNTISSNKEVNFAPGSCSRCLTLQPDGLREQHDRQQLRLCTAGAARACMVTLLSVS